MNHTTLLAVSFGLVACGPPDVKYETRFLEIAPYFDFPVCEGTARTLDEHVAQLSDVMKVSLGKNPLRIYWGQEGVSESCSEGADGCYSPGQPGTVFVHEMSTLFHELVHAVGYQHSELSTPLLEEGIADALSMRAVLYKSSKNAIDAAVDLDYSSYLSNFGEDADILSGAGHFVTFLHLEYGIDKILDLKKNLPDGSSRNEVEETFAEIFGTSLADVLNTWQVEAPDAYHPRSAKHGLRLPWQSGSLRFAADFDCAAPETMGPIDFTLDDSDSLSKGMYQVATFDLLEPSLVRAELHGDTSGKAKIDGSPCSLNESFVVSNGTPIDLDLPPCRWQIALFVPHGRATRSVLELAVLK